VFFPLKYYARGRFPVWQVEPPEGSPFYYGTVALRAEETTSAEELLDRGPRRIWDVRTAYDSHGMLRPSGWQQVERRTFRQALYWRGELAVSLWQPD
jgi:hypothetical protein